MNLPWGVYAYRFPGVGDLGLLDLFAMGHQDIRDPTYRWHGLERTDGPLLLFQYTLAGEGLLETPERTWHLGPGTGMLLEIPSDHVYRHPGGGTEWDVIFLLLRPRGAESLWNAARKRLGTVAAFPADRGPVPAVKALILAAASGRITNPFDASALSYDFLLALLRPWGEPTTPVPLSVVRAQVLLDEGWNRPWKLAEVAKAVGLSPAHFHRTFRRHTGVTPLEWLSRHRMEKAVELLGDPDATVERVARTLGFGDTGHFIRIFRRWTGLTPGALKSNPSAWAGSKIVLSTRQKADGQDSEPRLS